MADRKVSRSLSTKLEITIAAFVLVLIFQLLVNTVFEFTGFLAVLVVSLMVATGIFALLHFRQTLTNSGNVAQDQEAFGTGFEKDSVSGALSLRSLTISLLESMALAERYNRDLSVVQIVIDDFDTVQSRFGSSGIDAAAVLLGSTIRDAVRMPDRVGRYAPNSFILVLPETQADGARQFAERIRRLVVDAEMRAANGERFSISVSVGVTRFEPGDDPQRIIERAEKAMQEAQSLGGNRTLIYEGDV